MSNDILQFLTFGLDIAWKAGTLGVAIWLFVHRNGLNATKAVADLKDHIHSEFSALDKRITGVEARMNAAPCQSDQQQLHDRISMNRDQANRALDEVKDMCHGLAAGLARVEEFMKSVNNRVDDLREMVRK
ncbi:MAG: hypothetical protein ACPGO3_00340 [Magnetospiraceae bacterium]